MTAKFRVGQKVIVTHRESGSREAEVTKVGRTLVYARDMAFHIDTGVQRRGPNAAGYAYHILTPDEHADEQRRLQLRGGLNAAGIRFADFDGRKFTTSQLERLLAVASEPDLPEDGASL